MLAAIYGPRNYVRLASADREKRRKWDNNEMLLGTAALFSHTPESKEKHASHFLDSDHVFMFPVLSLSRAFFTGVFVGESVPGIFSLFFFEKMKQVRHFWNDSSDLKRADGAFVLELGSFRNVVEGWKKNFLKEIYILWGILQTGALKIDVWKGTINF